MVTKLGRESPETEQDIIWTGSSSKGILQEIVTALIKIGFKSGCAYPCLQTKQGKKGTLLCVWMIAIAVEIV